jgi:hypothetical protein
MYFPLFLFMFSFFCPFQPLILHRFCPGSVRTALKPEVDSLQHPFPPQIRVSDVKTTISQGQSSAVTHCRRHIDPEAHINGRGCAPRAARRHCSSGRTHQHQDREDPFTGSHSLPAQTTSKRQRGEAEADTNPAPPRTTGS